MEGQSYCIPLGGALKAAHICFEIDCTAAANVDELAKKQGAKKFIKASAVTSKQSYILWVISTYYLSPFMEARHCHKSHLPPVELLLLLLLLVMSSSEARTPPQDGGFRKQLEGGLK